MTRPTPPRISVITLNYNGGDDTIACVEGLRALHDPGGGIEIIVVDNASTDGSRERVEASFPEIKLVKNKANLGFAGGCNSGVAAASGDIVAFINNDARPDVAWLTAAYDALRDRADVAAVASKVVSWDGTRNDFDGRAGVTFYGFGYREGFGEELSERAEERSEVLFGTGSALVVRKSAFDAVGGFDERYFLFFEDVDFGWRLWLAGYRVLYVPESLVFHRHHGTMERHEPWREDFLLERNALFTLIKNLDDHHLATALPAALLLGMRRGFMHDGERSDLLDIEQTVDDQDPRIAIGKRAAASAFAIDQVARRLPELMAARRAVQSTRVRQDHEIMRLVRHPMLPSLPNPEFRRLIGLLNELLDIEPTFSVRRRVAVVTGDPLGRRLSGPGIRALELARVLSRDHDVRLASTSAATIDVPGVEVVAATGRFAMRDLEAWCDVLVFQGFLLYDNPSLVGSSKTIVVDLYDPFHLEQLEQSRDHDVETRTRMIETTVDVLNEQIRRGDFFICASTKQRDFWLGQLAAVGRINPINYDTDGTLESLLAVVPFGISESPPQHERPVLRGVVPGIGADDKVLIWGGGLYPWFDPVTLVEAIDLVRASVPEIRMVFMGAKHPNSSVPPSPTIEQTRAAAADAGILDTHVFLLDHWVDYDDRQNYLLEADIGVSTHHEHIETAYSFRTRILDYLWAGLPVITTGGDAMGDLVEREGLGRVVDAGDVKGLASAIVALLQDDATRAASRANVARVARDFEWSRVAAPLVEFCARPSRAPDLMSTTTRHGARPLAPTGAEARRLVKAAIASIRNVGVAETARRVTRFLRRTG